MSTEISGMSLEQLKALAYDQIAQRDQAIANLQIINQQIQQVVNLTDKIDIKKGVLEAEDIKKK